MRGRYGFQSALLGLLVMMPVASASASDLVVAVDPSAPTMVPPAPPVQTPPAKKKRDSVAFAASLYAMTATATDDFAGGALAFMARPALEAYVAIGLGDMSLVLGGTTLAIEVYAYDYRSSVNYPALWTIGLHHDRWLVELAGGASLFTEDSEGPFELAQGQDQIPSPRAEVRAGARFMDLFELRGVVGAERRIAPDVLDHSDAEQDSVTRFFTGVAFGIGGG